MVLVLGSVAKGLLIIQSVRCIHLSDDVLSGFSIPCGYIRRRGSQLYLQPILVIMTRQLLPDDILILVLEEHLTPSTGHYAAQRLQTIKNFSLSSRTLALASRRLVFEHTKVVLGGTSTTVSNSSNIDSAAEGLRRLFEVNPSYRGFVNSLRIETGLLCGLVEGAFASDVTSNSADIDNRSRSPHEAPPAQTVSIRYTSTPSEEAAVCWLLSQRYPNLKSFHFIIRPPSTDEQITLWKGAQLGGAIPSLAILAGTKFPQAIVRFLSARDQPLEHLTLSSNLPSRILRYLNGSRPLKTLSLTNFSEVEPIYRSRVEAPFYWGANNVSGAFRTSDSIRIEVEDLRFDMTGRNALRWVQGPDCSVDLSNLQTLHLNPADEGRAFPLSLCRTSLNTLDLLYSSE